MERAIHERHKIGVEDAVLLDDCSDRQMFIDNLQKRLRSNLIYTYIGPVLVSVNPYKSLPIYDSDCARLYKGVNYYEQPPHIFALANQALTSMVEENCDQCILISGESGAGKTEASKKILQYIGFVCEPSERISHSPDRQRHLYQRRSFDSDVAVHNIRDRLVLSNPVLEAFGNARTVRNDNSSRFGKYMDVEFNFKGQPTGGHIRSYLLERSRVVSQATGECNFHIFHALLTGGGPTLLQQLRLQSQPDHYRYTKQGASDLPVHPAQFASVTEAMRTVGFSGFDLSGVLHVVAGVLHMGNVSFTADNTACRISDRGTVENFAKVIGLESESIIWALTHRTIEAQHDVVKTELTADQACYARDALSKSVYSRLFDWLVARLNNCLAADASSSSSRSWQSASSRRRLLGILDIYGFEVFATNSFEQFCINYCNEKLQQLFIELTLKSEQQEYMAEGIAWQPVEYFNNKVICDMIEQRHTGIISLLDEECMRPGEATDFTFLEKMTDSLAAHEHFVAHRTADASVRKHINRHEFRIVHYAGGVTYSVISFLDKNNDRLYRDLKHLMAKASISIVQELFPMDETSDRRMPETVATQFRRSLDQLMTSLMSKSPSYIRCIKPNQHKRPTEFDSQLVSHQVQYLGLMENLRVRRAGFAYRRRCTDFLQRYKSLCPQTWPSPQRTARDSVDTLMKHMGFDLRHYALGRSKIFIRLPQTIFQVEDAFQLRKHDLATLISKTWRGYHDRKRFLLMRRSVTVIARHVRGMMARRLAERRRWAVGVIRSFIMGFMTRNSRVETSENRRFIGVMRREWLHRLSRHLPAGILQLSDSSCWPPAPPSCQQADELLRPMYSRQLVRQYRSRLTEQRLCALQLKVIAEDLFKGRKAGYNQSIAEWFQYDRTSDTVPRSFSQRLLEAVARIDDSPVQYQTPVVKFDRHGYRCRQRHLVLTTRALHVLSDQPGSLRSTLSRRSRPVRVTDTFAVDAARVTVTAESDHLLVVSQLSADTQPLIVNGSKRQHRSQPEEKHSSADKYKGDLILLPENIYELLAILHRISASNLIVDFVSSKRVPHELSGGLRKHVEIKNATISNQAPSVTLLAVSDDKHL